MLYAAMAVVSVLTGFSKATALSVIGMLNVIVLSLVIPAKEAVGLILLVLIIGDVLAIIVHRRSVSWAHLIKLSPWVAIGLIGGYIMLRSIDSSGLQQLLGFLLVGMLIIQVIKDKLGDTFNEMLPDSRAFTITMGLLAGFSTMIGNVAGIFMAIYLFAMALPKQQFVGTSAFFFFLVNVIKVPFYVELGMIGTEAVSMALMAIPFVAAGSYAGVKLLPRIPFDTMKTIIIVLGFLGAIRLIIDGPVWYALIAVTILFLIIQSKRQKPAADS